MDSSQEPMGLPVEEQELSLSDIAREIGGVCEGDPALSIKGVAGIKEARAGQISFLANSRYLPFVRETKASALIVAEDIDVNGIPAIRAKDPYLCFLRVVRLFARPLRNSYGAGLHPTAVVAEDAELGAGCHVGAHAHVGKGCRLGANVILMPGVVLLERVQVGDNCIIFPNVVIREACRLGERVIVHAGSIIGSDGYGYAHDGVVHHKIPQIGIVEIEEDVEIGANVSIDRATTGITRIGRGCKIDNLVHIAHNVEIGEHSLIIAQVGISGSARVGAQCVIGGQAGLAGHIDVGDGVRIAGQSGVTKSVKSGICVSGYPARPHEQAMKQVALGSKLPSLINRVKNLESELAELKAAMASAKEGEK